MRLLIPASFLLNPCPEISVETGGNISLKKDTSLLDWISLYGGGGGGDGLPWGKQAGRDAVCLVTRWLIVG